MNTDFHNVLLFVSAGTFLQIGYRDFHLTVDVLLHYLAKSENPIYSCFKNNSFLFSYFFAQTAVLCNKIFSKEYFFIICIFFANNDVTRYAIVFC